MDEAEGSWGRGSCGRGVLRQGGSCGRGGPAEGGSESVQGGRAEGGGEKMGKKEKQTRASTKQKLGTTRATKANR